MMKQREYLCSFKKIVNQHRFTPHHSLQNLFNQNCDISLTHLNKNYQRKIRGIFSIQTDCSIRGAKEGREF